MKFFEEPIVKLQKIAIEDIITASGDSIEPTTGEDETDRDN